MSTTADKLASEIRDLPDVEKLRLVDAILTDLDKPDPEIDRIWADEARKRWAAYKAGRIPTLSNLWLRPGDNRGHRCSSPTSRAPLLGRPNRYNRRLTVTDLHVEGGAP